MTRARDIANFGDGIATADIGDGQITTAKIASDAITDALLPTGSVLQVVSDSFSGTESTSVKASDNNFADTSLSVTLTPTSTNSKIVVTAMVNTGSTNNTDQTCILRMTRNGTAVAIGDADGSRIRTTTGRGTASVGPNTILTQTIHFIDEPNTTSAVTYTVQFAGRGAGGATVYINRSSTDANSNEHQRTASFITAMEIAG